MRVVSALEPGLILIHIIGIVIVFLVLLARNIGIVFLGSAFRAGANEQIVFAQLL